MSVRVFRERLNRPIIALIFPCGNSAMFEHRGLGRDGVIL